MCERTVATLRWKRSEISLSPSPAASVRRILRSRAVRDSAFRLALAGVVQLAAGEPDRLYGILLGDELLPASRRRAASTISPMRLDLCRIPAASASMARGRARVNPRLLVRRGRRLMLTATQLFGWS
jgi:hypothetical protein